MKIVIVNGSPRKGNTVTAINAFVDGLARKHDVEILHADQLQISPCKGCEACGCTKGCVATDDSNATVDKIVAADFILFATPVYWWGVSAQLKLVLDKCYCKGAFLKDKKVGIIAIGGSGTDNLQYTLIRQQFECIAEYLAWNILFYKPYSASAKEDLAKNTDAIAELKSLGKLL